MINGKNLPAVRLFDVAHGVQEFAWIGQVPHARVVVDVAKSVDLDGAPLLPADDTTGLVRRIAARVRHQFLQLSRRKNHLG